jgi:hypothetical protein
MVVRGRSPSPSQIARANDALLQLVFRADADVTEHGQAEKDALPGVAFGLAVERLMLPVLLEQDHRQ